jgi:acetyltransferase-like isoleucine patch superfamily enzyme
MMKKILLSMLILMFGVLLHAQNPNKPTRAVLYQMSDNEALSLRFLHTEKSKEGIRFAAVTFDFVENHYNFIVNGRIIKQIEAGNNEVLPFSFFYLDIQKKDAYGFMYQNAEKRQMNFNGRIIDNVEHPLMLVMKNDKIAFTYVKDNLSFAWINGKIIGPFAQISDLKYTGSGKFMFNYYDELTKSWFVNVNSVIYGPYSNVFGTDITESGNFVFSFKDDAGFNSININGKIMGPYQAVGYSVKIASLSTYIYSYRNNDQWIVNISGKTQKEYAKATVIEDVFIDATNKWAIKYQQNSKTFFVINGANSDENSFAKLKSTDFIKNNFVYGYAQNINFTTNDGLHNFNSDIKTNIVTIDGKEYGNSYAINAYYDSSSDSFVWLTAEKNKLIRYELKL